MRKILTCALSNFFDTFMYGLFPEINKILINTIDFS